MWAFLVAVKSGLRMNVQALATRYAQVCVPVRANAGDLATVKTKTRATRNCDEACDVSECKDVETLVHPPSALAEAALTQ